VHNEVLLALGEVLGLGGEGAVSKLLEAREHELDHFGFDAGADGLEGVVGLERKGPAKEDGPGVDAAGHEMEGEADLGRGILGFEDGPFDNVHAAVSGKEASMTVEDSKAGDIQDGFADETTASEEDEVGGMMFEGGGSFGVVVVWDGEEGYVVGTGKMGEGFAGEADRMRIVNYIGLVGILIGFLP
jgi:hypothetical protein